VLPGQPQEKVRMLYLLVALGAYLLGSIPSGYLIGKSRGVDLRTQGSGNIGATNALRVLGKKWGYLCFALDAGKGVLSVLLAKYAVAPAAGLDPVISSIVAAVCTVLGHNFPVWLKFKGGKGVATSAGAVIGLFPLPVFVCSVLIWVITFKITRIVSVASIVGAVSLSLALLVLWLLHSSGVVLAQVVIGFALSAMMIWRHRSNIGRLMAGTEPRFEKRSR
jgi:glycerol-3-phosphate acyltransferase PlsY